MRNFLACLLLCFLGAMPGFVVAAPFEPSTDGLVDQFNSFVRNKKDGKILKMLEEQCPALQAMGKDAETSSTACFILMLCAVRDDDRSTALKWGERAVLLDPDNYLYVSTHSGNLKMALRGEEEVALLEGFVERFPDRYMARFGLALSQHFLQRDAEAEANFITVRKQTKYAPLLQRFRTLVGMYQAEALIYQGRSAEALPLLMTRLRVTPESPTLQARIGSVHYLLGDHEKALKYLDFAYKESPDFIVCSYYRGLTLEAMGRGEAAMKMYKAALKAQKVPANRIKDNGEWMLTASRIAGKCGNKEYENFFRESAKKAGFTFLPEDKLLQTAPSETEPSE